MAKPDRIKDRYLKDLDAWLTPELLYHCFTGEDDPDELERIRKLDYVRQVSLLDAAFKIWPQRLHQISQMTRKERRESKARVQKFVNDRLK